MKPPSPIQDAHRRKAERAEDDTVVPLESLSAASQRAALNKAQGDQYSRPREYHPHNSQEGDMLPSNLCFELHFNIGIIQTPQMNICCTAPYV